MTSTAVLSRFNDMTLKEFAVSLLPARDEQFIDSMMSLFANNEISLTAELGGCLFSDLVLTDAKPGKKINCRMVVDRYRNCMSSYR